MEDRDDAVLFASAISITKALGVLTSMFLVDRAGRRFLLITGSYAAAVAMVGRCRLTPHPKPLTLHPKP